MHSEILTLEQIAARSPAFRRLHERVEQQKRERLENDEWERENPQLAIVWAEALAEDEGRDHQRNHEEALKLARGFVRDRMARMGVDRNALEALRRLRGDAPAIESTLGFLASNPAEQRFLVLCGPVGTGKTVAAAYAFQEHLRIDAAQSRPSGNEWAYVDRAVWLLSSSLARLSLFDRDEKGQFEVACRTPLLVIDDYGAEFQSGASRALLEELLIRRNSGWLRTVLTTNLDPEALKGQLGERLVDRINTCCIVSVCQGDSLRQRGLP